MYITFMPLLQYHLHRFTFTNAKALVQTLITRIQTLFNSVRFLFSSKGKRAMQQQCQNQKETYYFINETPRKLHTHTYIILIRCEMGSLRRNAEFADFQSYFHVLVALHRRLEQIFPFTMFDRMAKPFIKMIFISFIIIFNNLIPATNGRGYGEGVWWRHTFYLTLQLVMRRSRKNLSDE